MWPLLACSLAALAQTIERALHYMRLRIAEARSDKHIAQIIKLLGEGAFDEALAIAEKNNSISARVIAAGLRQREVALLDSLNAAAAREIASLRRGLSILDTIITLAPLLGILGTVTGIIRSFHMLSAGGAQDPVSVSGGIAEALITTAAGLVISIFALIPFNAAVALVRNRTKGLEQLIHAVVVACERGGKRGA